MENPFGFFKRNASAAATDVDAAMSDVGPDELQIVEQENEQASPVLSADEDNFNLDDMLGDLKLENEGGPESVAGGLDLNLDDGSLDFLKDNGDFDLNLGEEITSVSESEKSPEAENPKPLVSEAVQEVSQPDIMEFSAEENRQETSGGHDEEAFLSPLSDDESDLLADRDGYTDETPVSAAEERVFEPEAPIAAEEAFLRVPRRCKVFPRWRQIWKPQRYLLRKTAMSLIWSLRRYPKTICCRKRKLKPNSVLSLL